jgi:predicted outer membrane repeat protein
MALPSSCLATVWVVPTDTLTIQGAISLAATGDTIEVQPGTYTGAGNKNLDFGGRNLVLRSTAGAGATIVDCQGSGRGLVFQTGETNGSVVQGFTIRNGRIAQGGAILCSSASPTIVDCVLTGNRADESGGAIACRFNASPRILQCRIENNSAFLSGGGISCINAFAEMVDLVVTGNTAGLLGGGIYCREASPSMTGCQVLSNVSNGAGGGLVFYHLSAPVVTDCAILGNQANGSAGGVFCDDFASPDFVNCVITGNRSEFSGGGILCTGRSSAILCGSTLSGNHAVQAGGGLYAETLSSFHLDRTIVWGNCAATSAEAHLTDAGSQVSFSCSAVDSAGVGGAGTANYTGSNVFTDPLFCSPQDCLAAPTVSGSYEVDAASPCLPAASPCDSLIGASGQACGISGTPMPPEASVGFLAVSPSPFWKETRIHYELPGPGPVHVSIHDLAGRFIRDFRLDSSSGTLSWDGTLTTGHEATSGIYFVRVMNRVTSRMERVVRVR